ncbi:hypothetical protein BDV12DRAFT_170576 [Aspergillus spectabilis]
MERQSSTYGQACMQCYKAKCRCVRSKDDTNCERCLRLKKRCQPPKSVRRRDTQKSEESETRIARLEEKIAILLSAMPSSTGSVASGSSVNVLQPLQPLYGDNVSSTSSYSNGTLDFNEAPVSGSLLSNLTFLSPDQAEERVDFFRSRMLPYFPFIDLTPDMTSSYLRQNRPFILQAICTVTTFSTQERLVQVEELKRVLFTSSLLQVESTIDLLLGLLTYLAWSTDAFLGRADLVSRLMMLAISLVYDLRLFNPSSLDVQLMMSITQGVCENGQSSNDETPYSFLEKQRAVLACFVLSSNISSHLGRQDALRWTPQMEEALHVLTITKSCPADALFVSQVRLQLLKQKAEHIRRQDDMDYTGVGDASAPRSLYLKTLRRQLNEVRSSFPTDLPQIDILTTHAHYVDLYITQLCYSLSRAPPPVPHSVQPNTTNTNEIISRLSTLWHSLTAMKSWLDTFYTLPPSTLLSLPFHFWSQMILTITLLKYLSTLADPDWDREAVRDKVHLLGSMGAILRRLELGSQEGELRGCDDHLLVFLARLISRCRVWGEMKWDLSSGSESTSTGSEHQRDAHDRQVEDGSASSDATGHSHSHSHSGSGSGSGYIPDLDQMAWMQEMDLGDDRWFEDVLGIPATLLV